MRMAAALAWSRTALATPILALLSQNTPLSMWTIFDTVGSFHPGGAFAGQWALIIESLLLSGHGQVHEPPLDYDPISPAGIPSNLLDQYVYALHVLSLALANEAYQVYSSSWTSTS